MSRIFIHQSYTGSPAPDRDEPPNMRPKLSTIFAEEGGERWRLTPNVSLDPDQRLSRELESLESHSKATSAPEPDDHIPVIMTPTTSFSDEPAELGISPAAMFLSSFSPVSDIQSLPDDEGETVAGYQLGPVIGYGGFSIIRRASSAQGNTVAVKVVRRSDLSRQADPAQARKRLDHESAVWSALGHEHILPLFSVVQTLYADFFVTLYCPAGSLFDILKRDGRPALPQDDAGMMFRQVVRGLRYLHEVAGYVHGDIKLENVLVDEMGVCRIADFGMARRIGESDDCASSGEEDAPEPAAAQWPFPASSSSSSASAKRPLGRQAGRPIHLSLRRHYGGPRHRNSSPYPTSALASAPSPERGFQPGSLPYASPELLLPSSSSAPFVPDPAQDIWALGVLLYALLTGRLPFVDSFDPRLQMKILHGVYDMPKGIGRGAERVLQGCLERSVPNRWTIAMVDEVAWGIGWGSAGDDVTPPPELRPSRIASRSNSGSRTNNSHQDTAVADDPGSPRYHPSRIPSTQSASRPAAHSRRKSRSASRRRSPPPDVFGPARPSHDADAEPHPVPTVPTFSALTGSIFRTSSMSSSASSGSAFDSAVLMSPGLPHRSERERGRRPTPKARIPEEEPASRSVSPLETLLTPTDVAGTASMRGLKSIARVLGEREEATAEAESWLGGDDEGSEGRRSSRSREARWQAPRKARSGRPESMPPAPSPSLAWAHARDLGYVAAPALCALPRTQPPTRSRSVDLPAGGGDALRHAPRR